MLEVDDREKLDSGNFVIKHYDEKSEPLPPFLSEYDYYFEKTGLVQVDEDELEDISESEQQTRTTTEDHERKQKDQLNTSLTVLAVSFHYNLLLDFVLTVDDVLVATGCGELGAPCHQGLLEGKLKADGGVHQLGQRKHQEPRAGACGPRAAPPAGVPGAAAGARGELVEENEDVALAPLKRCYR